MSDAPRGRTIGEPIRRFLSRIGSVRLRIRWPQLPAKLPKARKKADARHVLRYLSDARAAADLLRARGISPEDVRRSRLRFGTIVACLVTVFVLGLVVSLFGSHGYGDVRRNRRELNDLQASVDTQQDRVIALKAEVQRLKEDPYAIERVARERLGYARPGELTFLLPHEDENRALLVPGPATAAQREPAQGGEAPGVRPGPAAVRPPG